MAKYRKYSKEFKLQAAAVSYFESQRVYGYRKVYEDLAKDALCCKETVRRIMRDIGLFSRIKRKIRGYNEF